MPPLETLALCCVVPCGAVLPHCRQVAQVTVLELLEGAGLPPLCVAVASEELEGRVLGQVLAEAVKVGRGGWERGWEGRKGRC